MEDRLIEVNEKAHMLSRELHVRKELRFVHREHALNGFQLHHNFVRNNEIDAVFPTGFSAFIDDRQLNLTLKRHIPQPQLLSHTLLVHRFE